MTEQSLESTHVGPVAGGHLRASDADRDQVAEVMSMAFAEGRLSREEYDERLDALLRAKTFDDLVGLTRDLVVVASPATPPSARPAYAVEQGGPSRVAASIGSPSPDVPQRTVAAGQPDMFCGVV